MTHRHMNLKCSLDPRQIQDRLQFHPDTVELQLFEADMETPERIVSAIRTLKDHGVKVFLHHPMTFDGQYLDIMSDAPQMHAFYRSSCATLDEICATEDVYCVVHPHYSRLPSGVLDLANEDEVRARSVALREAIQEIRSSTADRFVWENTPEGIFASSNPMWFTHIVEPLRLPICYDISHSFMSLRGDNDRLWHDLDQLFPYTKYYHVVDSVGTAGHDALPLGEGAIDWTKLKPYIVQRDFIFEIMLKDHLYCTEMVDSVSYFEAL